jgi:hypothetical protein
MQYEKWHLISFTAQDSAGVSTLFWQKEVDAPWSDCVSVRMNGLDKML